MKQVCCLILFIYGYKYIFRISGTCKYSMPTIVLFHYRQCDSSLIMDALLSLKRPLPVSLNLCIVCQEIKNDKVLAATEKGPPRVGVLTWKEDGDERPSRPPFYASPAVHKTPLRLKSIHKILIWKINVNSASKINNFQKIRQLLGPEGPIWPLFWSKSLEIWSIISYQPMFLTKVHSQALTFTAIYLLTSPQVQKSGPHIPTRKKVKCPPPAGWGVRTLKGVTGMSSGKDSPFSCSLSRSTRPLF